MANAVMIYYKNKVRHWGVEMGDERPVANWVRCTNDVPSKKHGSLSECIPDAREQREEKEESEIAVVHNTMRDDGNILECPSPERTRKDKVHKDSLSYRYRSGVGMVSEELRLK